MGGFIYMGDMAPLEDDVLRQGADLLDPPSQIVPKGVTDAIRKTLSPAL